MNSLPRQLLKNGKPVPLVDSSTWQLPKERWKDIPDFEGLYQLSDYGRVKSLSRWVYSENKPEAYRPGRIIKLRIGFSVNAKKKTTDISIQVKLHKDGIRYQFSVARYVYNLFVKPFDVSDHTLIVRRKDGDMLNCYYRNLILASISDVAKEGYANKKRKSKFQEQIKPVSQYSLDGKYIKTYSSSKKASKATGAPSQYINDAARTKVRPTANSYWRYGKPKTRINVAKLKTRLQNSLRTKRKRVQQLTLKGRPAKIYNSVSEAAKAMNMASCSNISLVCMGKLHTSKGYRWRYVK